MKKLSIIIPVYNEATTIEKIVQQVEIADTLGVNKELLIIDDGSTDGTREVLKTLNPAHRVILHAQNLGKGGAIQTGLTAATGDLVLIQDADLEYTPNDYAALLRPILSGQTEVTLGSRSTALEIDAQINWRHPHPLTYFGNILIRVFFKIFYNASGTDFFACYKILPRELFRRLNVRSVGFAYDAELLCKLFRRHTRLVVVPIHYYPRTFAEGKKIRYRDGLHVLWTIFKWRFLPF